MCSARCRSTLRVAIMGRVEPIMGRVGLCGGHRGCPRRSGASRRGRDRLRVQSRPSKERSATTILRTQIRSCSSSTRRTRVLVKCCAPWPREFAVRDSVSAVAVSHRVDARLNVGEAAIVMCRVRTTPTGSARRVLRTRRTNQARTARLEVAGVRRRNAEWVNCPLGFFAWLSLTIRQRTSRQ